MQPKDAQLAVYITTSATYCILCVISASSSPKRSREDVNNPGLYRQPLEPTGKTQGLNPRKWRGYDMV